MIDQGNYFQDRMKILVQEEVLYVADFYLVPQYLQIQEILPFYRLKPYKNPDCKNLILFLAGDYCLRQYPNHH